MRVRSRACVRSCEIHFMFVVYHTFNVVVVVLGTCVRACECVRLCDSVLVRVFEINFMFVVYHT